jgi:hypothetical protein
MIRGGGKMAFRDCSACEQYIHNDGDGGDGEVLRRPSRPDPVTGKLGLPQLRRGVPTPCWQCPKTEGAEVRDRAHATEVGEQHLKAYFHFMECRAVNRWPDDPIVRRNARVFRAVLDAEEAARLTGLNNVLGALASWTRK